ncbi:MAG: acyl-CoA dehydrogenase family protein [Acidimicrobiales bacterium]|nr:acyl-CoA dehydrogenase family protein [Acidimicrobiales bacterium]MDG2217168.1 acyl-CoA dehydrogenase family protein [Acidimicrobiales bacterium]
MDFSHSARSDRLLDQLRDFVETRVTPAVEIVAGERADNPGVSPVTTERLIAEAKNVGLWNLCVRHADYGPGLLFTEYAQLAEFMGPHPLAQEVTNCDAPSNINGDAMIAYGSPEQKGRWVEPQLDGQIKSAFAMTEPAVASSDAANLATTAVKDGDHWILNGRKWYVSGVLHPKCAYMMTVANTAEDGPPHGRHTQFILPVDTAGVTVVRNLPKFGYFDEDGHVELTLEDVRVPDANVLGEVGGGFAIGQARLGPARVQHCMRIIGIAEEALRLMCERAPTRSTFGAAVSARSNVMDWIGEARIEIEAARLMVLRTAWLMDTQGDKASAPHMSQIKVQVVRSATTVVDRAIQVFGAAGVSEDTPLARWYATLRSLRIADGPDEVHLMGIARRELRRHA